MSQSVAGMPDFELPDNLLAVIPTDPYDQLDLARKITSMAIASRVSKLEYDSTRLKQKTYDQERHIIELQEKASGLEKAVSEADSRVKIVNDENVKLVKERDALSATVKKLTRDLAKLETFKRQLMQSLSEDSSPSEAIDIRTIDQAAPKSYPQQGGTNRHTRYHSYNGSNGGGAPMQSVQTVSMTPNQITPRLTPTATPSIVSARGSPKSYSAVGSPQKMSGTTTPTKSVYGNQTSLSSWYPSSQQSSAANSPPRVRAMPGQTPRIDGKEFFRQARSRLSYEQFGAFLTNVKELNAQKQSREETLRKAEEIFGKDNKDLYVLFQGLLSRNVH